MKTHRGKRIICGVIIDASNHAVISEIQHIPDPSHDGARQAQEAHHALTTALKGKDVRAAVLLEADFHQNRRLTDGWKERLRLEGVCLAASLERVRLVEVMNGPALGRACNTNKDGAIDAAKELGVEAVLVEAAAAALAAKSKI